MKEYYPYIFLGKYTIGNSSRELLKGFIKTQYHSGKTLRTSCYGDSNLLAIDIVKELNREYNRELGNKLEVFIPTDNTTDYPNMYTNSRTMDYEIQNIRYNITQSDVLDFIQPFYTYKEKLHEFVRDGGKYFKEFNGYDLFNLPEYKILKSLCASNMLLGLVPDTPAIEVVLYGSDKLRDKYSRINTTIDTKLINLVKMYAEPFGKPTYELDLSTQSFKLNRVNYGDNELLPSFT